MKGNVPAEQAVTRIEHPLPARVQEALGELVGVAQEGLLALSVGVGLGVLAELMEEEVTEVVGPKRRHDPERRTVGLMSPATVHHGQAQKAHDARAVVLKAAYVARPERFINRPPIPPALPGAAWINKPTAIAVDSQEAAH